MPWPSWGSSPQWPRPNGDRPSRRGGRDVTRGPSGAGCGSYRPGAAACLRCGRQEAWRHRLLRRCRDDTKAPSGSAQSGAGSSHCGADGSSHSGISGSPQAMSSSAGSPHSGMPGSAPAPGADGIGPSDGAGDAGSEANMPSSKHPVRRQARDGLPDGVTPSCAAPGYPGSGAGNQTGTVRRPDQEVFGSEDLRH